MLFVEGDDLREPVLPLQPASHIGHTLQVVGDSLLGDAGGGGDHGLGDTRTGCTLDRFMLGGLGTIKGVGRSPDDAQCDVVRAATMRGAGSLSGTQVDASLRHRLDLPRGLAPLTGEPTLPVQPRANLLLLGAPSCLDSTRRPPPLTLMEPNHLLEAFPPRLGPSRLLNAREPLSGCFLPRDGYSWRRMRCAGPRGCPLRHGKRPIARLLERLPVSGSDPGRRLLTDAARRLQTRQR